jgi:hypothetical protein
MNDKGTQLKRSRRKAAGDMLREFVGLFENRGWLERTIRIRRRGIDYTVFCSRTQFLAYRLNDRWGLSPGIPGWPVCCIDEEAAFHDSEFSAFSSEPGTGDWLACIANDDFEVV